MQVGKNHTSLFHRGSFSVFLLRSRFTAGLFSFFASFGFFVFVPSVAVPFFTVVTTSAVTKGREKKQPSNNCMMLQAPFNCRIPKKTAFAFVFANWHLLLFRPHVVCGRQRHTELFTGWYVHPPIPHFLLGNWDDFSNLELLLTMSCPYWHPFIVQHSHWPPSLDFTFISKLKRIKLNNSHQVPTTVILLPKNHCWVLLLMLPNASFTPPLSDPSLLLFFP